MLGGGSEMSVDVICHGCGQAFSVESGYARNKIQCPSCGVICPIPLGGAKERPRPAAPAPAPEPENSDLEDESLSWLLQKGPELEETAPAPPKKKPRKHRDNAVPQGSATPFDDDPEGRRRHQPERKHPPTVSNDDDNADPYTTADRDLPICPKCRKQMEEDAVVCVSCGFDVRKRKKIAKSYEVIARAWDSTLSLRTRMICAGLVSGFVLMLGLIVNLVDESDPVPFLMWFPLFNLGLVFVLGTFERVILIRNDSGRSTLTRQWRVCFLAIRAKDYSVRGYGSIVTAQLAETSLWEWFIFSSLLFSGVLPGLLFWYFVIHKPYFYVALTQDHGHPELFVYRGRSEQQMRDVRDTLIKATGLQLDN
jgi:hypothetical protein